MPSGLSLTALEDTSPQPASLANNWNCCNRYHVEISSPSIGLEKPKLCAQ
jgi:hypothetical protein